MKKTMNNTISMILTDSEFDVMIDEINETYSAPVLTDEDFDAIIDEINKAF